MNVIIVILILSHCISLLKLTDHCHSFLNSVNNISGISNMLTIILNESQRISIFVLQMAILLMIYDNNDVQIIKHLNMYQIRLLAVPFTRCELSA